MKKVIISVGFLASLFAQGVPEIEKLKDLDGKIAKLSHQKDTELVVFWATWCPECKEKLGDKLPKLDQSKEVSVVTINMDRSADRAKAYVEKEKIKLPVFRDEDKVLRSKLQVYAVPHWAVYKKSGENWKLIDSAPAFEWERVEKALKTVPSAT